MSHQEEVQDPLKPLDRVMKSDPRHHGSLRVLEQQHSTLAGIQLHEGVPLEVRQLFETAKNVSLYTWFVYRFHQVAQLVAYTALERALKVRAARETGITADNVKQSFRVLLQDAVQKSWLKPERFSDTKQLAHQHLEQEQVMRMIQGNRIGDQPVEIPKISDTDILARRTQMTDYVNRIVNGLRHVRNHLAHGEPLLMPGSEETLRVVAETINQLFENG